MPAVLLVLIADVAYLVRCRVMISPISLLVPNRRQLDNFTELTTKSHTNIDDLKA